MTGVEMAPTLVAVDVTSTGLMLMIAGVVIAAT